MNGISFVEYQQAKEKQCSWHDGVSLEDLQISNEEGGSIPPEAWAIHEGSTISSQ